MAVPAAPAPGTAIGTAVCSGALTGERTSRTAGWAAGQRPQPHSEVTTEGISVAFCFCSVFLLSQTHRSPQPLPAARGGAPPRQALLLSAAEAVGAAPGACRALCPRARHRAALRNRRLRERAVRYRAPCLSSAQPLQLVPAREGGKGVEGGAGTGIPPPPAAIPAPRL